MASLRLWRRSLHPGSDGQDQAAIYRERAAHLRAIGDAEADPILRQQLRDLADQYDEIANSAVLRRKTLQGMQREFARRLVAETQRAGKIGQAVEDEKD